MPVVCRHQQQVLRFEVPALLLACPQARLKVRVVSERAYHALFMHNMLVRRGAGAATLA